MLYNMNILSWGSNLTKKICKYLLQRYIGQFLEEKLKLEQLNVDIGNGTGTAESVTLSCEMLNQLFEEHGLNFSVTKGYIGFVTVNIPWNALMKDDCYIEVGKLYVALKPIQRKKSDSTSMLESMWSSMSSSMQLAQDCIETEGESISQSNTLEGLERFALVIENVLKRVKIKFVDTTIRVEYLSDDEKSSMAIIMHIDCIEYENETGADNSKVKETLTKAEDDEKAESCFLSTYTSHHVKCSGITFYTEEFYADSENATYCSESLSQEHNIQQTSNNETCETSKINNSVPFAKVLKDLEIRIKLKEVNSSPRPKVELEVTVGTLIIFMTPRQVQMIIYMLQSLTSSSKTDDEDYKNKEKQNTDHQIKNSVRHTACNQGWVQNLEMLDNNSCFSSVYERSSYDNDTFISLNSSMESSSSSVDPNHSNKLKTNTVEHSDVSHIQIRISFLVAVILHDDITFNCPLKCEEKQQLCGSKARELEQKAEDFFIKALVTDRISTSTPIQDVEKISCIIQQSLDSHNLLFVFTPIIFDGEDRINDGEVTKKCSLSIAHITLIEDLNDTTIPLLEFSRQPESSVSSPQLALKVVYEGVHSKKNHYDQLRKVISQKTCIELSPFVLEFDISITDRIGALLYNRPFNANKLSVANAPSVSKNEIIVNAKMVDINVKFPVTNLRPLQDSPWWNRNIRNDFLIISIQNMCLCMLGSSFSIKSNQFQLHYCEKEMNEKIEIARIFAKEVTELGEKSNLTQPEVLVIHKKQRSIKENNYIDSKFGTNFSAKDSFEYAEHKGSSPFSAKRVLRESETSHGRETTSDPESFSMPGDKIEMQQFCDKSMSLSNLHIEFNFPTIALQLRSKAIYEILYNRINSDLLLWQPSCPHFKKSEEKSKSFSDTSFGEANENMCFSDFDKTSIKQKRSLNESTVQINIGNGIVNLYAPVQNTSKLSNQVGEFSFRISDSYLFLVNGFKGNPNNSFICFNTKSLEMYHCGYVSKMPISSELKCGNTEKHLKATIYPTPKNLCQQQPKNCPNRDMISVAVQIEKKPSHNLKLIKVSIGIQTLTLRHFTEYVQHAFYTQLHDMFSVLEYPVNGYQPLCNIIELHTHLWDCSVDYRPLNLPYRAILKTSTVMISSNISSDIQGCTLRFVADDCTLSLAPLMEFERISENHEISVLSPKYLVCIVELGLFEISMRISEKTTKLFPKADLRLAINDVHVRTCSDSAAALAKLLLYLSNEGDLCFNDDETEDILYSKKEATEPEEKVIELHNSSMLKEQQNVVKNLLIDAMKEFPDEKENDDMESWYIAHENKNIPEEQFSHSIVLSDKRPISEEIVDQLMQVQNELGEISNEMVETMIIKNGSKDVDDDIKDFDFLTEESLKDYGNPFNPVCIVDNHFTPHARTHDLLKTPPEFPMAVLRYTLCEMSFSWHMFGGNDFENRNEKVKARYDDESIITFPEGNMSDLYKSGVSFSKGNPSILKNGRSIKTWRKQGGHGRDHGAEIELVVSKVRLVHETYPTDAEKVSRQVLLITDIEILDKIKTSDINKLLYCGTDPKERSSQHMIYIEALHSRANSSQECDLRISILPLRLNIDQDTLEFIIHYIQNINNFVNLDDNSSYSSTIQVPAVYESPVMTIDMPEACRKLEARKQVLDSILLLKDDSDYNSSMRADSQMNSKSPLYIRSVIFGPDLHIRFDYHGKRVDFSHGSIQGLCMGLGQLNCSKIILKHIHYRHGILGVDKLLNFLLQIWLNDIKKNQLPRILGGVGPMNSFIELFQGIFDLIWLPVHQYQKDGHIVKGFQLGCQSFTARTTLAALEITSRFIYIIQFTAETIYDMLSPGPSLRKLRGRHDKHKRLHPPQDIREGVSNAYHIMKEGLGDTANQIVDLAVLEHDQKGAVGAVGAVLRQIPPSAVRPIVLVSQATSNVLGGVKNQLIPEARKEARQKWKSEE